MDVRRVYKLQRETLRARDALSEAYIAHQAALKAGQLLGINTEREQRAYEQALEAERAAQAEIGGKVFRVANMGALEQKIKRFQKKAEKLGSGEITFVKTDETDVEWYPVEDGHPGFDWNDPQASLCAIYSITFRYVIVSGEAPKLPGWTFVATIEHTDAGNIVRDVPVWNQEQLVSEHVHEYDAKAYRTVDPYCAHCGLPRYRKDTFLVREDATGELKQVGRNCLADFTGINDPMRAAKAAEWYRDFFLGGDDEDMDEVRAGAREEFGFAPDEFLAQAAAFVRTQGYKKSGWEGATGEAAWYSLMNYGKLDRGRPMYLEIEEQDRQMGERVRTWVESIPADTDSDYLSNVRVAILSGLITWRRKGIAASAITAFEREQQRKVEQELREEKKADQTERAESAGFLGEPKQRLRGVELTVTFRKYIEPTYERPFGKTILKFETPEGHAVTWFASQEPYLDVVVPRAEGESEMEHVQKWQRYLTEGDKIKATFTVKAHEDSERWGKATIVNRLVIDEVVEAAE